MSVSISLPSPVFFNSINYKIKKIDRKVSFVHYVYPRVTILIINIVKENLIKIFI